MKQSFLACLISLFFVASGFSQARINAKIGVESWVLRDEISVSGKSMHPGQFVGFDVYVEKNRGLFVPGFHYHRIAVENGDEKLNFNFHQDDHLHYFTIPLTFGYKFLDRSVWNLALLAGGEVTFFYDLDANSIGLDDDMLYGVSTGLTTVLHTEIASVLTAEIKYHYGLQPIIKIRDQSKLRGLTFAVGIKL